MDGCCTSLRIPRGRHVGRVLGLVGACVDFPRAGSVGVCVQVWLYSSALNNAVLFGPIVRPTTPHDADDRSSLASLLFSWCLT